MHTTTDLFAVQHFRSDNTRNQARKWARKFMLVDDILADRFYKGANILF